ncbi:MAG: hypothetical protein N2C14_22850, partial [Planctomycetales bacterium]
MKLAGGPAADQEAKAKQIKRLQAVGETCESAGLHELAGRCADLVLELGPSAAALIKRGGIHFDREEWKLAAERFRQAWEKDDKQTVALYLQGRSLVRGGDAKEGERLVKLAESLVLGDDAERHALVSALDDRGLSEDADRQREFIIRTGGFNSWQMNNARMHLGNRGHDSKNFQQAADYYERYMLGVLRTSSAFMRSTAYLVLPQAVYRAKAQASLKKGDVENAMKFARQSASYLPEDSKLPLEIVPELDRLGQTKEADELFELTYQALDGVIQKHPNAATRRNNAAWLAAQCNRRLPDALRHAESAVSLRPGHAGNLDTLAEVHFRLGNREKAVETIQRSLAIEPDSD